MLAGCTRVSAPASNESAAGPAGRHSWTVPNTLRVAFQDGPNTLQPILASNTSEVFLNRLTCDPLVTTTPDGKTQIPVLAAQVPTLSNGGISRDGLTITYHLRRNITWHDGAPFTSDDVRFSYQAVMNSANNVESRVGYDVISRVDTPARDTVVFHLKRRFAPFVNTVFGDSDSPMEVVPAHLLAKLANINKTTFNDHPIGTGPYRVTRWVRGDHIDLVANDRYFLGKPKIHAISIRFIPDENTEVNALRTHDVDWLFEASPSLYKVLKGIPDVNNVLSSMNQYEGMYYNVRRPPLDNVQVRRAIQYALNRPALMQKFTFGSASVADQDLPTFMWAHDPGVVKYPYDPARARALLRAAGWTPGSDGVLVKNGQRLALTVVYNVANATRRGLAVQVQEMLKGVGIDTSIKTYPISLFAAPAAMGGIMQGGKYDLALHGWISGVDPDNHSAFTCDALPPGGNNNMFFCDKRVDAAEAIALEHYDEPTRKKAYAAVEKLLAEEVPQTYFWYPRQIQALNPDLKGVRPNAVTEAWNAYQWEI